MRAAIALLSLALVHAAPGVMYNRDTGDTKSRELATLPPFNSKANIPGCSAVLIAPNLVLSASHCVNYAAAGTTTVYWNGQTRTGGVFTKIGADTMLVVTDTPFTDTLGKMTAPYGGSTENNRLAWKVGSGGNGILGPGATGPFYDGIFRAMSTRIEVNNVASPPPSVTTDYIYYDFDGPPSEPTRTTTLYEGGTAPGDSGGPLYMFENGRWHVIALTSGPDAGFYRDGRIATDAAEIESMTGYSWAMPVTPQLEMKWVAQDLAASLANGAQVSSWPRNGGGDAWAVETGSATLAWSATPTGKAAVDFPGSARLTLPAVSNPAAGETSFTVAVVMRADAAGSGAEGQWHQNTGLIDAEEAGTMKDWGLAFPATGKPALGIGNADTTIYAPGSSLVDGSWHVLVASWDGAEVSGDAAGTDRNMNLYVDSIDRVTRGQGAEFLNLERNTTTLALGGSRLAGNFLDGRIAEVRMYRGALSEAAVADLLRELKTAYIAPQAALAITTPTTLRPAIPIGQGLVIDGTFTGTLAITQSSGPGPATLSSSSSLPARLSFPSAGIYQFQLAATSNAQTVSETLQVEVIPAIPSTWAGHDIGATSPTGSSSLSAGTHTLSAAGADIWSSADAFHFAHKQVSGDLRIQCRVTAVRNTDPWAKAGLMFRDGTAANAKNVLLAVTPGNGITRQYRNATGGTTASNATAGFAAPYWIRLERRGDTFHSFRSTDGISWTAHQPAITVVMPPAAEVGLALTSHLNGTLCQASFDNLSIEPLLGSSSVPVAGAWTSSNIGDANTAGSGSPSAGSASLTGAGMGFQEVSDSLRFSWQALRGDGSIVARVSGFTSDNGGKAFGGIMFRSSLDRESSHAAATVLSSGGVRFTRRLEDAAYTETTSEALSAPQWLKLTRVGNVFSCQRSADGITWAALGSAVTITDAPATMYAGLLIASVNNNGNSVAHFTNISTTESGSSVSGTVLQLPPSQNPALSNNFTLAATSSLPAIWSWAQVSGPATTIFRSQNTATPQVAPSAAGAHVIRATADANGITTFIEQSFDFHLDARWNFTSDAEGWIKGGGTGTPAIANGIVTAPVTAGDPQWYKLGSSYVGGDLAKHVLVRCRSTAAGNGQIFWGQATSAGFAGSRVVTSASLSANVWRTVLFDPSAHADWAGKRIIDLRYDPPGGSGSTFDIDWIALSDGDLDNDGMPDLHELAKNFDPDSAVDAAQDADGDGWSNLDEYITGTDPRLASSRLVVSPGPNGLTFTRLAGRSYTVQASHDLKTWSLHAQAPAGTGPITIPTPPDGSPHRFYRILVALAP